MPTESDSLDSSRVWAERMLQQLEDPDDRSDSHRILQDNPLELSNLSSASIGSNNSRTISPLPPQKLVTQASPASVHSDSTVEYGSPVNILSSSFSYSLSESQLSSSSDFIPATLQQNVRKLAIEEFPVIINESPGTPGGVKLDLDQQLQEIESKKKALQSKTASESPSVNLNGSHKITSLKLRTLKQLSKSTIASPNASLTSQLPLKKNAPIVPCTPQNEDQILQELPKHIPLPASTTDRNAYVTKINSMLKESGIALLIPPTPVEGIFFMFYFLWHRAFFDYFGTSPPAVFR